MSVHPHVALMPVQGSRGSAKHAVPVPFRYGLRSVLLAFNRVTLAGNRLAVHDVDVRTGCDSAARTGQAYRLRQ